MCFQSRLESSDCCSICGGSEDRRAKMRQDMITFHLVFIYVNQSVLQKDCFVVIKVTVKADRINI